MAEFDVKYTTVKGMSGDYDTMISEMNRCITGVREVANNLDYCESIRRVRMELEKLANVMDGENKGLKNLQNGLTTAMDNYMKTEIAIISNAGQGTNLNYSVLPIIKMILAGQGATDSDDDFKWFEFEDLLDAVSAFGLGGAVASDVLKLLFGQYALGGPEDVIDILKDANDLTGNIADFIDGEKGLAALFGVDTPVNKSIKASWADEISKYDLGAATSKAQKVSVISAWLGGALTVASEGFENYADNANSSDSTRWVKETIGESAVNILKDLAINAGMGAAVGSVFPGIGTVAGAIVAVAGTVVVDWGLDKVCEYFWDKEFDECVSDLVIDGGEWLIDKAGEGLSYAADAIGNGISYAADAIGDGISYAADAVSDGLKYTADLIDDIGSGLGNAVKSVGEGVSSLWNNLTDWGLTAYA